MDNSRPMPLPWTRRLGLPLLVLGLAAVAVLLIARRRDGTEPAPPSAGRSAAASQDNRPLLRVAVAAMISPKPTRQYYDDLLRLIGDRIGRRVDFVQRKTYAEVNDLLERGEIDMAFVCSGPYVLGHAKFGMEILAVPVAHGEDVYYSYFIVNRDSKAKTLDDLRGKSFAFTDPESNTGCLVPKYVLARRGQTPASFFGSTFFTHSHDNSIKAVAEGLADGAAVDQLIWDFLQSSDPTYTRKTKVISKSPPYGMPPVVVNPWLDDGLKRELRGVFLALHEDQASCRLLRRLQIDRFKEGNDAMYDSVRQMQQWVAGNAEKAP
jgi:phosphonate transport system substrate-binding protein